ncbi:DUF3489 domain-containing protein [Tabrizicola sp.]|uniref:DUF3489 domain-containing protein n=1 Tax=Tabrizicola sp. TaxID=2005166 RepID=UPI003F2ED6A4
MTTRKHDASIPDAPRSESLNDEAKANGTASAATPPPPRPERRPKAKRATLQATTAPTDPTTSEHHAPNGADPATGKAVANARAVPKLDRLFILLRQPDGATITELMGATGWQAHSVRGAIAGALRKKGHTVVAEKTDGGERRYRLREAP